MYLFPRYVAIAPDKKPRINVIVENIIDKRE